MKIASKLSISKFKASNGWLHAFKNRNQISSKAIVSEEELVDKSKIISFKDLLTEKLLEYDPKNIFNCDETDYFLNVLLLEHWFYLLSIRLRGIFQKKG